MFRSQDRRLGRGVPYLRTSLDLTVPAPIRPLVLSGSNQAQGDLQLMPLILQWTPSPGGYTNFQLVAQLPTGSYDKARLINAGTNQWTLSPTVAVTWIMPSGAGPVDQCAAEFQWPQQGHRLPLGHRVPAGVRGGPAHRAVVNFFDLGSGWPIVWAHAYKEFGARNRSQGRQFTLQAAWTF